MQRCASASCQAWRTRAAAGPRLTSHSPRRPQSQVSFLGAGCTEGHCPSVLTHCLLVQAGASAPVLLLSLGPSPRSSATFPVTAQLAPFLSVAPPHPQGGLRLLGPRHDPESPQATHPEHSPSQGIPNKQLPAAEWSLLPSAWLARTEQSWLRLKINPTSIK